MQEKVSQSDLQQMIDVCLSGFEGSKEAKQYKQICDQFIRQIMDNQKNRKNQDIDINIKVYTDQKSNSQSHQSFILGCLLFLFLKYRYLKVVFIVSSKPQLKSINREKNIVLNINKIELKPEFYNKICAFINNKQRQHYQSFYFFKEIWFKARLLQPLRIISNQVIKSRINTYKMIHQFYKELTQIMPNKNIYLMKNRMSGFDEILRDQQTEKIYLMQIIKALSQIHCLVHVFMNLTQPQLLDFLKPQRKQIGFGEIQNEQQQDVLDKGVFKQFKGSTLQYLQKLVIVIHGTRDQMINLTNLLSRTPNLSHLQIHNKTQTEVILPEVQRLLQVVIQNVPFIKKINFQRFRIENIQLDLLHRLYLNCPYLVDLSIGLTFEHSITETYQIQNFQDKKALQVQREKLFILQALRMRNITLNNSFQTVKLLLKKGYNFLSALQIIDCIQPICV